MHTERFAYRLPASRTLPMVLVALAIPVALTYLAITNQESVRVSVVVFSTSQASVLFWALAAASFLAALAVVWFALRSHSGSGQLELGPTGALLPRASLSSPLVHVPYSTVVRVRIESIQAQQIVIVSSSVGELRVSSLGFATPSAFSAFVAALQARVRAG